VLGEVLSCELPELGWRNRAITAEPAPANRRAEYLEFCGKALAECVDVAQWIDDFSASTIAVVEPRKQQGFRGKFRQYFGADRLPRIACSARCFRKNVGYWGNLARMQDSLAAANGPRCGP
jgi:hypothetical protein